MACSADVVNRIGALLDNKKYSDVEFIVKQSDGTIQKFYAHKLILATASRFFSKALYESTEKDDFKKKRVYVPDSTSPPAFYALLQYLYTDKLHPRSWKEAFEIYKLAWEYEVEGLRQKCVEYLLEESVDNDNIFALYECALKENIADLINTCRKFVQREAKQILESHDFSQTCTDVVLDVLKQDNLSINSEMEIINAVLKWCFHECKRKKQPADEACLGIYLTPYLKHLRFLSLNADEFLDFSENNNIFTSYESTVLTRKILQPNDEVMLPEHLCAISRKRNLSSGKPTFTDVEKSSFISEPFMQFPQPKFRSNETNRNAYHEHLAYEEKVSKPVRKSFDRIDSSRPLSYNMKSVEITDTDLSNCYMHPAKPLLENGNSHYVVPHPANNLPDDTNFNLSTPLSYTIKGPSNVIHSESINSLSHPFGTSPNDSKPSASREILPDRGKIISFYIPLEEAKKELSNAFNIDMKCNLVLKMLKGSICIHGLELSIKGRKIQEESLEVILCLTGFSEKPIENVYDQKLEKNILEIQFPNPVKLQQNSRGEIEITIESLRLDRCSVCRFENQNGELMNGLNVKSEIFLGSNQNTKEGFFFLISKINYSLC